MFACISSDSTLFFLFFLFLFYFILFIIPFLLFLFLVFSGFWFDYIKKYKTYIIMQMLAQQEHERQKCSMSQHMTRASISVSMFCRNTILCALSLISQKTHTITITKSETHSSQQPKWCGMVNVECTKFSQNNMRKKKCHKLTLFLLPPPSPIHSLVKRVAFHICQPKMMTKTKE